MGVGNTDFELRTYRTAFHGEGLIPFRVVYRESDLLLLAEKDLSEEALKRLLALRQSLESYILKHPDFLSSLKPLPLDPKAPVVAQKMLRAAQKAGVGPMAAVAGAIAEELGQALLAEGLTSEIVVENGGDIFLATQREVTVAIWAGASPLSGKIGLRLKRELMPCAVCTSSGTVGHSLSLGRADALCVIAKDTALADAYATSLANLVKGPEDFSTLKKALQKAPLLGVVCVVKDQLFAWGKELELVTTNTPLQGKFFPQK